MLRRTSLYGHPPMLFHHPRLYLLNDLVLPVYSQVNFQKKSLQNAISLYPTEQYIGRFPTENEILRDIHEDEQIHGEHPILRRSLEQLAIIYLSKNKIEEAEQAMIRAVRLDGQIVPDSVSGLHRQSNLGIISYFNRNTAFSNKAVEFCVKKWLNHKNTLELSGLPYFYNLVATNETKDPQLMSQAIQFIEAIRPKIEKNPFWKKLLDELPLSQEKREVLCF